MLRLRGHMLRLRGASARGVRTPWTQRRCHHMGQRGPPGSRSATSMSRSVRMYPALPRATRADDAAEPIAAAAAAAASFAAAAAAAAAAVAASAAAAAEAADLAAAAVAPHMSSGDPPARAVDAADAHEPVGLCSSRCSMGSSNWQGSASRACAKRNRLGGMEQLMGLSSEAP